MDFESKYHKSQVNGTIYVNTRHVLPQDLQDSLESGAGELFLNRIPKTISPEMIIKIASSLGEIYALRYKIDFSGESRGFAYLQYIDETLMFGALRYLKRKFIKKHLDIRVFTSLNCRELLLERVHFLNPVQVYNELRKLSPFIVMRVFEYRPMRFRYILEYRNNTAAAIAHRELRNVIRLFGPQAFISWLDKCHPANSRYGSFRCCQDVDLEWWWPDPSKCNCFRIKGS